MGPAELVQAVAIARQHFLEGRTKTEIAATVGLSRYKVARIIEACLAQGVVRIEISVPSEIDVGLSEQLRRRYGLRHGLVVSAGDEGEDEAVLRRALGAAAAALVNELVHEEDVLGIGWGRTVAEMASALVGLAPCAVVQMTGIAGGVTGNPVDLVRRLTTVSGGAAFPIYAPLVVSDTTTAQALYRQPGVLAATSRFPEITKAVVAVGSWDADGSQLHQELRGEELGPLAGVDVVGEVCSRLLDRDGRPVRTGFDDRTVGITLAQLRAVPEVIAVAGGAGKVAAVRAVLRGGYVDSLITDRVTAQALLSG